MPSPFGDPEAAPSSPFGDPIFKSPGTSIKMGGAPADQHAPLIDLYNKWGDIYKSAMDTGTASILHGISGKEPIGSRVSDVLEGFGTAMSPMMIPMSVAAPIKTASSVAGGLAGAGLGYGASYLMGNSPETNRAVGDIGAIPGAMIGHEMAPSPGTLADIYSVVRHPITSIASAVTEAMKEPTNSTSGPYRAKKLNMPNYGGPTEPQSQAFPAIPSVQSGWTPPSGSLVPGPEPIVPQAPTPYSPKKLNMPKYGGSDTGDYSNTPNNRIWNKRAGIQPVQPEETPAPQPQAKIEPVTITDPAQVKAFNRLNATVNKLQGDKTMAQTLLKSIVQKQFGVDDPRKLGKEDLDTITSLLQDQIKKSSPKK